MNPSSGESNPRSDEGEPAATEPEAKKRRAILTVTSQPEKSRTIICNYMIFKYMHCVSVMLIN